MLKLKENWIEIDDIVFIKKIYTCKPSCVMKTYALLQ